MGIVMVVEEEVAAPVLPTPVVCSATILLSSLLTLVVVEAGTSCRSSVVALGGSWTRCVGCSGRWESMGVILRLSPHLRLVEPIE
jgi:hypothetical protein